MLLNPPSIKMEGAQWLSGRELDSRPTSFLYDMITQHDNNNG